MMEELEIRERIGTEFRQWHYNKTENTKKSNNYSSVPDISGANKE